MSFHSKKANKPLSITELVKEATNLYRTKEYIIKQRISICNVEDGNTVMVSDDVFYLRTPARQLTIKQLCVIPIKHTVQSGKLKEKYFRW